MRAYARREPLRAWIAFTESVKAMSLGNGLLALVAGVGMRDMVLSSIWKPGKPGEGTVDIPDPWN
jgi:hypothetical protein